MTDLEALSSPAPRAAAVVRRFVGRLEPASGFVAYGALVTVLSLLGVVAGGGVGMAVWLALGLDPDSAAGVALVWTTLVAGAAAPWLVFARWVGQRRGRAAALVRDGARVDGRAVVDPRERQVQAAVEAVTRQLGGAFEPRTLVEVVHDGVRFRAHVPFAATGAVPLLVLPGHRPALAFDRAGAAVVVELRADRSRA